VNFVARDLQAGQRLALGGGRAHGIVKNRNPGSKNQRCAVGKRLVDGSGGFWSVGFHRWLTHEVGACAPVLRCLQHCGPWDPPTQRRGAGNLEGHTHGLQAVEGAGVQDHARAQDVRGAWGWGRGVGGKEPGGGTGVGRLGKQQQRRGQKDRNRIPW